MRWCPERKKNMFSTCRMYVIFHFVILSNGQVRGGCYVSHLDQNAKNA